MKILVTGGAGFIGSNFIHYWNKNYPSDEIICYDKLTYAANLDNLNGARYELFQHDICNYEQIEKAISLCDLVVHFAAESHVDNSIENSDPFIQTNIIGTHNILKACLKNNKRLHHVSTDEVYGSLEHDSLLKFTEKTKYDPHSPYSASKASSDHLVKAFYDTYGLKATLSNCSNNYGPRQHKEKLIPKIIQNILNDKIIPIYGDGKNVRDWIHVDDHCRAIDFIIKDGIIGDTYLVGGDCELTNLEIVEVIANIIGDGRYWKNYIKFVKDRLGHDKRYAINCKKLKDELKWKHNYTYGTFHEGIKETIKFYKEN